MARYRPKVPPLIKRALLQQTGGKCANPGCANCLLEIHHIKQWAVYQTHDEESMIAICPTCHDAVTRGKLTISDEELYTWKRIERSQSALTGHLFVEPGPMPRPVLGAFEFIGPEGVTVFEFENSKLSLAVREQELAILNLKTVDSKGEALVDVVDNYVRQRNPSVVINSRPGRYQVQVATADEIYPPWALECLSRQGDLTQLDPLDIQVLEPGVVRVRGIFLGEGGGVVIDEDQILLLSRKTGVVLSMKVNSPGRATFVIMDVIDQSVFGGFIPPDFW